MDVSLRIQRIVIRSWPYQLKTEWIPGKNNSLVDALRQVSFQRINESDLELPIRAVNILSASTIEDRDKNILQQEIKNCRL